MIKWFSSAKCTVHKLWIILFHNFHCLWYTNAKRSHRDMRHLAKTKFKPNKNDRLKVFDFVFSICRLYRVKWWHYQKTDCPIMLTFDPSGQTMTTWFSFVTNVTHFCDLWHLWHDFYNQTQPVYGVTRDMRPKWLGIKLSTCTESDHMMNWVSLGPYDLPLTHLECDLKGLQLEIKAGQCCKDTSNTSSFC